MPHHLPSELAGPALLLLIIIAAIGVAARQGRPNAASALPAACLCLALQALHVGEEFAAGFHVRAPLLAGLRPWSPVFFVWINVVAIAAWLLALRALAQDRAGLASSALLWFLAIASIGNGFWHPAASVLTAAYFPGTATAPFLGIAGYVLARRLAERSAPSSGLRQDIVAAHIK